MDVYGVMIYVACAMGLAVIVTVVMISDYFKLRKGVRGRAQDSA